MPGLSTTLVLGAAVKATTEPLTYGQDTEQYYNKIVDENNRTKQLRHILFEPSPICKLGLLPTHPWRRSLTRADGGLTLFENFDDDVQQQIKVFLGRLVHMLKEALDLLESRYGNNEAAKKPSMTTSLSSLSLTSSRSSQEARSPSPRSWKHYSRQSISLLKWSLQDKKRTEEVLKDFSDLNGRIHENIKLWCLASSIGLNMQHLKRLQNDENAKQLGFDIDATLQITATEVGRMDFSFELSSAWLECLRRATPVEERFALVQEDGKTFLMEHRRYDGQPDVAGEIDSRTRIRINDLAGLLSQPKEKVFCIPRCVGWKYVQSQSDIAFLFETPQGCIPEPVSLYRLLDMKTVKLTLGQRFKYAIPKYGLSDYANSVTGWHPHLRSA